MKAFDYDASDVHLRYDRARGLPDETVRLWLEKLSQYAAPAAIHTIVDVGCGTGRFTGALATHFSALVYGIDPSKKMLDVARTAMEGQSVELREGCAESLPLDDQVADLIFLSMVYHHIQDKAKACAEFRRVLRRDGHLCIRASTREQLDSYLWQSFFPEAREIELHRAPSAHELTTFLEGQGFKLEAHELVQQRFAHDLSEYCEKIGGRGLSSLQAIPDEAFEHGLGQLRAYCDTHSDDGPVYESIDLFVFRQVER